MVGGAPTGTEVFEDNAAPHGRHRAIHAERNGGQRRSEPPADDTSSRSSAFFAWWARVGVGLTLAAMRPWERWWKRSFCAPDPPF